jgi:PAS domain S-box-containing protein
MSNASQIWSDEELVDIGRAFMRSPWARPISVVARLLYSAADFYRWTARPGPISGRHFSCIQPMYREIGPNQSKMEFMMQRGYEPCREFYLVTLGVLASMPTVLGLEPATVEMRKINDHVHYFIDVPAGGGALAGLRKAVTWPFSVRAAARELQEANAVLVEKYQELEAHISERMQAEEALAKERNLLRTLIDNLPDYIYVKDSAGRFVIGNQAVVSAMGAATIEELVGKSDFDFHPPELAAQYYDDEQAVIESGQALINREEVVTDASGAERRLLSIKVPLRDGDNKIQGLVGIGRDVTELKRAEEALRESEERFRRAFDDAPIGMALVGLDEGLIQVNQALCNILGYTKEELLATTVPAITHPDDLAAEAQYKVQATGGTVPNFSMEKRYIRADGEVVWGQLSVSMVNDSQGSPLYFIGQLEDITERKRVDKALRFQKALLEAQNEATLDGIMVVSAERQWLFHNQRLIDMWGFPKELVHQASSEAALEWAKGQVVDPEQFILRNEEIFGNIDQESRDEIKHKDGRIFDRYGAPVKSADGEYYGRVWYYRDITDRRKLEEQLRQSQKMEAVGQLAGGVAHNFNNMLTAIMGYAGLALETLHPGHSAEADLRGIQATARRAADLTQQLLALTRRQVIQPRIVILNDLVSSVSTMLRQLIAQSIELVIFPEPDLYDVKADPSQIEQVLVNLVINAQDAMPQGGTLSVKTSNVTFDQSHNGSYTEVQPGHYVSLVVSDTGIGISEDIRAHIFEPFFTTKDVGHGTGLGLATCFGIVQQNQGYIDVSSNPGRGTTVSVYLPRYKGL